MATADINIVAPIVKGTYSDSVAYSRLNIVHGSDGATYQAIKAVPAGTALTNTEYWMQITPKAATVTAEDVANDYGDDHDDLVTNTGTAMAPNYHFKVPRGVTGNESIDDTKGDGDTDYVWSADKSYNEVTDLKSQIIQDNTNTNQVLSLEEFYLDMEWTQGSVSSEGVPSSVSTRIRTHAFMPIMAYREIKFDCETGYKFSILIKNYDGTSTDIDWTTGELRIGYGLYPKATDIWIILANTSNTAILPSAGSNLTVSITTKLDDKLTKISSKVGQLYERSDQLLDVKNESFWLLNTNYNLESARAMCTTVPIPIELDKDYFYTMPSTLTASNFKMFVYNDDDESIAEYSLTSNKTLNISSTSYPTAKYFRLRFLLNNIISTYASFQDLEENLPWANLTTVEPVTTEYVPYWMAKTDNLKSLCDNRDIARTNPAAILLDNSLWNYGTVYESGRIYTGSNNRIYSELFYADKGDMIFVEHIQSSTLYSFFVVPYNDQLVKEGQNSDYANPLYEVTKSGYYRLVARINDNSEITTSLKADITSKIHLVKNPINLIKNATGVKSIAHRGYSYSAPENTIPAFIEAYRQGFEYVEMDPAFTSDDEIVLLHDDTINRTARNADGSEISSEVNIWDITYSESQQYDFGIWKGSEYAGTKIPKLFDVLVVCKKLNLKVYVDVKNYSSMNKEKVIQIVNTVRNAGMIDNATFTCATAEHGQWIAMESPISRLASVGTPTSQNIAYCKTFRSGYNEVFFSADNSNTGSSEISALKSAGLPCEVWVVNDTSDLDSLDDYISGVISDKVNATEYFKSTIIDS